MGAMKCSENSATCFFPIMSTWEFALNNVETDQCWLIQSSWAFATWGWIKQPCKWKAVQDSTFWLQTFRERLPFSTMLVMSKKDLLPNYNHLLPLRPFTPGKDKAFSSSGAGSILLPFLQAEVSLRRDTWEWSGNEWADGLNICRCSVMTTIKLFWSYYHIKLTDCNAIN